MRVRAVTVGLCGSEDWSLLRQRLRDANWTGVQIKAALEDQGVPTDFVRLGTDPFGRWVQSVDLESLARELEELDIDAISLGRAMSDEDLKWIPRFIEISPRISCSAHLRHGAVHQQLPDEDHALKLSEVISTLDWRQGFNFCVSCGPMPDNIPFLPVASREVPTSTSQESAFLISIATENSDILEQAAEISTCPSELHNNVKKLLEPHLMKIEEIVVTTLKTCTEPRKLVATYCGIDPSANPCIDGKTSIGKAIEISLKNRPIGSVGSISVVAAISSALRTLNVKTVGYAGVMLPVLEDITLCKRVNDASLGLSSLLQLSSVCGVGLDTIPISHSLTAEEISKVVMDVGALAMRWNKPLSIRLLRLPGEQGETAHPKDAPSFLHPAAIMDINS
ncbi:hypothetical protein NDN08_002983 [Rhodosorus marinus]|uniref:DUF711 family protein n=1 Tax=Rhodosorus marinus TaxID=101924 RepID=A0AAV8UVG8_9RHOD|nr:hypothetical protein NDN08_002983 [Rhodosorus marinus]